MSFYQGAVLRKSRTALIIYLNSRYKNHQLSISLLGWCFLFRGSPRPRWDVVRPTRNLPVCQIPCCQCRPPRAIHLTVNRSGLITYGEPGAGPLRFHRTQSLVSTIRDCPYQQVIWSADRPRSFPGQGLPRCL